jgi:hypothetical protein
VSAQDYSDIVALAKADMKLALQPDNVKPVPPAAGKFSGAPATPVAVKLLSIDDVRNVNIIKSGQTQPSSPKVGSQWCMATTAPATPAIPGC